MLNSAAATYPRLVSAREYFRYVDAFDATDRIQAMEATSNIESLKDVLLNLDRRGALVPSELAFVGEGI
jgi:hypothetical protein